MEVNKNKKALNILLIFIIILSFLLSILWIQNPKSSIPYEPLIVSLGLLTVLISKIFFDNRYGKYKELEELQEIKLNLKDRFEFELERIRELLKEVYLNRIEQKTDNRLPITFTLSFTREGTSEKYLYLENPEDENVLFSDQLIDLLKKYKQLLLVGEPGSGKSSELLGLALKIIEDESIHKIPIVLRLSYWKEGDNNFKRWLHDSIISGYGFSNEVVDLLIEKRLIIPLLDGLDEVDSEGSSNSRKIASRNFLTALEQYRSNHGLEYFVITSRKDEYYQTDDAPVRAQILLNPLSINLVESTLMNENSVSSLLKDRNNTVKTLSYWIERKPFIKDVLLTPFYFNLSLQVFTSRTEQYDVPNDEKEFKSFLINKFVSNKLKIFDVYEKNKVLASLPWIASQLVYHDDFELNTFEPSRNNTRLGELIWKFLNIILKGGVVGILYGSVYGITFGVFIFFFGGSLFLIAKNDRGKLDWGRMRKIRFWSTLGLFSLMGSIAACVLGLIIQEIQKIANESLVEIDFLGLALAVSVAGIMGLFHQELYEDLRIKRPIAKPYQRLLRNFRHKLPYILHLPLLSILIHLWAVPHVLTVENLLNWGLEGLIVSIVFFLIDNELTYHYYMRVELFFQGKMPFSWVKFFRYCTDIRILEQEGGTWKFRHKILQNHFYHQSAEFISLKNDPNVIIEGENS